MSRAQLFFSSTPNHADMICDWLSSLVVFFMNVRCAPTCYKICFFVTVMLNCYRGWGYLFSIEHVTFYVIHFPIQNTFLCSHKSFWMCTLIARLCYTYIYNFIVTVSVHWIRSSYISHANAQQHTWAVNKDKRTIENVPICKARFTHT